MNKRLCHIALLLSVLLAGACNKVTDTSGEGENKGGGLVNPYQAGEKLEITVATYNVLKPSGRREEMSLDNSTVRKALASAIAATKADIIGFNELDGNYAAGGKYSLKTYYNPLPDFDWKLEWPNKISAIYSTSYSYANGFAYDKTKFRLEKCSYVWLSKSSNDWFESPSSAYGKAGSPERTCIKALFTHLGSGKQFWLFVTHLPTKDQGGAENMAAVVNRFASSNAGDLPSILTGDMNNGPGTEAYRVLTSYWKDGNTASWGTLSGSSANYKYYSIEEFTTERPDRRIDHIMAKGCIPSNYRLITTTYTLDGIQWCPSDHLPVAATISF